jgi:hypothetical protein
MLQGYAFYATGSATGATATIMDPILRATVTTVVIRGDNPYVKIMGISFNSDAPALGSYATVIVGNGEPAYRTVVIPPCLDADLATQPVSVPNYVDLGGYKVKEQETITIKVYDPGAAELTSGVLWVDDMEDTVGIPTGRIISLRCGGTNDGGTSIATTGFDMDSKTLEIGNLYTPYIVTSRPEDKVVQAAFLAAGKDAMTLPGSGTIVYPHAPLQFTGAQYNSGHVKGYLQVQAATKCEFFIHCIETPGPNPSPSAPAIVVEPSPMPGAPTMAAVSQVSTTSRRTSGRRAVAFNSRF